MAKKKRSSCDFQVWPPFDPSLTSISRRTRRPSSTKLLWAQPSNKELYLATVQSPLWRTFGFMTKILENQTSMDSNLTKKKVGSMISRGYCSLNWVSYSFMIHTHHLFITKKTNSFKIYVKKLGFFSSWWFQPLWKIWSSNWESSPILGVKIPKIFELPPPSFSRNPSPLGEKQAMQIKRYKLTTQVIQGPEWNHGPPSPVFSAMYISVTFHEILVGLLGILIMAYNSEIGVVVSNYHPPYLTPKNEVVYSFFRAQFI